MEFETSSSYYYLINVNNIYYVNDIFKGDKNDLLNYLNSIYENKGQAYKIWLKRDEEVSIEAFAYHSYLPFEDLKEMYDSVEDIKKREEMMEHLGQSSIKKFIDFLDAGYKISTENLKTAFLYNLNADKKYIDKMIVAGAKIDLGMVEEHLSDDIQDISCLKDVLNIAETYNGIKELVNDI